MVGLGLYDDMYDKYKKEIYYHLVTLIIIKRSIGITFRNSTQMRHVENEISRLLKLYDNDDILDKVYIEADFILDW